MNKKSIIILIICFLIIVLGGVCFLLVNNETKAPTPPVIDIESGDEAKVPSWYAQNVIVETSRNENDTDHRFVKCEYPKITSLKNKEFENYINKQIANNINAYRAEIEFLIDEETPATAIYKYITKYDRYSCQRYLSLVIDQEYETGGIRSNHWKDIYNINTKTERIFYLNELFEAGVDFETAILEEIEKQAEAKNYELMGGNGLSKLSEKQKFYIKDDKLVIYFDPSEAAANIFGELHFEMPFTMNEDGYFEI